jgi:predicted amidohydrolase YtcJ
MNEQAQLYLNCSVLTMDAATPRAEALLVRDGRVAGVGTREEMEEQVGPDLRRVDLAGGTVVPGFNDCHCHILSFGLDLARIDLGADAVSTIDEIKRAVAERARLAREGDWVLGRGYDQNALRERRHPTRFDLDEVSRDHPVVLWHTSGHALTCNSRALQLPGITAATPTPPGGDIQRDEHGEPTGVLLEAPAMDLLLTVLPAPSVAQGAEAIIQAIQVMASQGITSASDAATGHGASIAPELAMYRKALESGRLAGRITLMPQIQYVAPAESEEDHDIREFAVGNEPERLQIGATKIFSDGALTTRTAAVREPFVDGEAGLLLWEPDVLADMILRAHQAGWQIGTHAIGDRAIELVLDCYEQALTAVPRQDHRHRIEHCMMLDGNLAERIRRLGVVPTIQPGFISRLGDAYIAALGIDRAAKLIPMQLFEALGVRVGFSSDRPVIPGAPLQGIAAAMSRATPQGVQLGPEHVITAAQAIRHYTVGSAFATHAEQRKGSFRTGMLADFTVLSRDPSATPMEELENVRVTMTVLGGVGTYP